MNRPYTAYSPYSLTPTERLRSAGGGTGYADGDGYDVDGYTDLDTDALPPFDSSYEPYDPDDTAEDYDEYLDEARVDRRWMWIGGIAGAILFVAVIVVSMMLSGSDSGSVSATVVSESPSAAAPTPSRAPSPAPGIAAPPSQQLPAETVTTVTPTPEAAAPPAPTAVLPPPQAAPPPPAAAPGTVTYRVTGDRALLDLVTIIYTDQQGALQTELNVALPWSKTVVLDPGVTLSSVTATSVRGKLNCSITDANGSLIAAQNSNSMITNCTR
ncbi:hypothetical protein [Mycobacterium sp. SMC-4]|uniref:hypothetical protein n=1 Tax=Mycobacterium sp. SMC-4 TaxID=2857059 RepID=UPI0021B26A3B|nr:hypothetical protein [Mycobacterium sp. SMC-4]UXA19365.1 hypothetical protein KXD98_07075 [Mycobacterium sp. SMC-4]